MRYSDVYLPCVTPMKFKSNGYSLLAAIVAFYLIPVLLFSGYSIGLMSATKSWNVLTMGLLLCIGGAVAFLVLIRHWEHSFSRNNAHDLFQEPSSIVDIYSLTQPSCEEGSTRYDAFQQSLKQAQDELQKQSQELAKMTEECNLFHKQAQKSVQDLSEYKIFSEEQLNQKTLMIHNLQQRLAGQQGDLEARNDKISQFESKIRDLSYEIKTLLQLNETEIKEAEKPKKKLLPLPSRSDEEFIHLYQMEEDSSNIVEMKVHNVDEASLLMQRCIDMAQKLTGANYYGSEGSRHRESSAHSYAIDLRRLFDSLRSESSSMVLVYSQKDDKLLFVNNQSRTVLGWSAEKFVQDFQSIIQKGTIEWKNALVQVASNYEANARVLMKTKTGNDIPIQCLLGMVPIGLFKGYIIGVLYPVEKS